METIVVCEGMGLMHSNVMDIIFHSGDAWDYAIKLSAQVSTVLCSE